MSSVQVVEMSSAVNNSPIQDYTHPDDHISQTYDMTPGFKPVIKTVKTICLHEHMILYV